VYGPHAGAISCRYGEGRWGGVVWAKPARARRCRVIDGWAMGWEVGR